MANYGVALTGGALAEGAASAQVPAPLLWSTAKAAVLVAARQVATPSPSAVVLMSGGLKAMLMKKLKVLAVVVLGLVVLGGGGGVLSYRAVPAEAGAAPGVSAALALDERVPRAPSRPLSYVDTP